MSGTSLGCKRPNSGTFWMNLMFSSNWRFFWRSSFSVRSVGFLYTFFDAQPPILAVSLDLFSMAPVVTTTDQVGDGLPIPHAALTLMNDSTTSAIDSMRAFTLLPVVLRLYSVSNSAKIYMASCPPEMA